MQIQKTAHAIVLLTLGLIFTIPHTPLTLSQVRKVQPPPSGNNMIILDIIQKDARAGMDGDEYLYFRLYESGRVEFEDRSQNEHSSPDFEMRKLKLKEEEKTEFIFLSRGCVHLVNEYDAFQPKEEKQSMTKIRIKYKEEYKEIVINNYWPEREKTKSFYPIEIKRLIEKAKGIRTRYDWEG